MKEKMWRVEATSDQEIKTPMSLQHPVKQVLAEFKRG